MTLTYIPKVLTANHLIDGAVMYFGNNGDWTLRLDEAEILYDETHAAARLDDAELLQNQLVGIYLADVSIAANGTPEPRHFREAFRASGPSNYPHGKQVEH